MVARRLKPLVILLGLAFLLVDANLRPAAATDILNLYGEENSGSAGAQFMRIPVGARAVALGKAYTSLATDGSAIYWNPAGMMRTPGRTNFFAAHTEYTADIGLNFLSAHRRGQNYAFGLSLGALDSGDILRTTELQQQGTGQYFNANQFFVGLSVARAMTDRFSIGGTVKYYQENLDQYQVKTVLADLGILYFVGVGDLRVGFAVKNFGGDLKPGGTPPTLSDGYEFSSEFQKFPAPTEGTFGAAKTWGLSQKIGLLTAADFNHPSGNKESFRFGSELSMNRMLFLRGGYETNRVDNGFTAGFGLQLKQKRFLLRVDYAYSDMGNFGVIHHFSVDLSPLVRSKDPGAWRRSER
jgi:hypothetical protein